jgi:hypothetical protein
MIPRSADSLDGRYFGPLPADSIVGRAIVLWAKGGVIAPPSRKSAATTAGDNRAGLSRISRSRHAEHALSTAANPACCVIGQARRARRREPRHHRGPDTYNPRDNFLASAAYLREIFDRYGSSGFLAAYNAGPARYNEHLATGRPLPPETKVYIAMLSPMMGDRQSDGRTVSLSI